MASILLTNDDGYEAKGIQALYDKLVARGHDVIMVAPKNNMSGQSFKINMGPVLKGPATVSYRMTAKIGEISPYKYWIDGTPVDCVVIGIEYYSKKLGFKPDLIVSGINDGENRDIIVLTSGTCGAAYFAAIQYQIPSIAFSLATYEDDLELKFDDASSWAVNIIESVLSYNLKEGFLNVVIPNVNYLDIKSIKYVPFVRKSVFTVTTSEELELFETGLTEVVITCDYAYDVPRDSILITPFILDLTDYELALFIKDIEERRRNELN